VTVNFLDRFLKKNQISSLIKILPVGAELLHADGDKDRQTDMMKIIVDFRNFARTPKNLTMLTSVPNTCSCTIILALLLFCTRGTIPKVGWITDFNLWLDYQ
jgi:hypothetical protein